MCSKNVLRVFQGYLKGVSSVIQGSFKGMSSKFQGGSKRVPGYFLEVKRVLECFKCVSRKFQESVQGVSKKSHVCHSSQLPRRRRACWNQGSMERRMRLGSQSFLSLPLQHTYCK